MILRWMDGNADRATKWGWRYSRWVSLCGTIDGMAMIYSTTFYYHALLLQMGGFLPVPVELMTAAGRTRR